MSGMSVATTGRMAVSDGRESFKQVQRSAFETKLSRSRRCILWALLIGATLSMSLLGSAACGGDCSPLRYDDVFPLDVTSDAGVSSNCGSLAGGCTPGQSCPAACDCVAIRERMVRSQMIVIDECTLVAGAGPPSVEFRSHLTVDCE